MTFVALSGRSKFSGNRGAFSLIELLSVLAVMALLISLTTPLISSFQNNGRMNDAVLKISLLLDQARTYAMARNTYVWIGFKEDGQEGLLVSVVAGTTGMASDIGSAANYRPITKVQFFEKIGYRPTTGGLSGMELANTIAESQIGNFSQQREGKNITFNNLVQFSPSGGVKIGPAQSKRWIELGLQPSIGGPGQANVAALQISSASGQVRIYRP